MYVDTYISTVAALTKTTISRKGAILYSVHCRQALVCFLSPCRQVKEDKAVLEHFSSKDDNSKDHHISRKTVERGSSEGTAEEGRVPNMLGEEDTPQEDDVDTKAHCLLHRPTVEAMMLRIQEIEVKCCHVYVCMYVCM